MNFKYRKKVKQTLAAVLAAMLLTGCAKGLPMVSEVNETKAYTLPQSMIIVATERRHIPARSGAWNCRMGRHLRRICWGRPRNSFRR